MISDHYNVSFESLCISEINVKITNKSHHKVIRSFGLAESQKKKGFT
jgi:hypothetical protein